VVRFDPAGSTVTTDTGCAALTPLGN